MRVTHLNCGTLAPFGAPQMVCHCLLIESERGLVAVDTGFGQDDIRRLSRRRPGLEAVSRPRLDPCETLATRVREMGHGPDDVTDIVLTHLDLDHAGGLPDFPRARVHVHRREYDAAMAAGRSPTAGGALSRYRPHQWAHGPRWVLYDSGGDSWLGFEGV